MLMNATKESLQEDARWIRGIVGATDPAQREEGYRSLMLKYWRLVRAVVTQRLGDRREAEDVTQEAFFRAWRSLDNLSEPAAFLGWLLRIAKNLSTDRMRSRRKTVSLDALGEGPASLDRALSESPSFEATMESEEETALAMKALSELPEIYREVVTLKYMQGLDGKEMAKLLGEPEGTIRNRLFRALEKLRQQLEKLKA